MSETAVLYRVDDEGALEMLDTPLPPEADMEPEDLAVALLIGSYDFIEAGCPIGEPPAEPEFALAA